MSEWAVTLYRFIEGFMMGHPFSNKPCIMALHWRVMWIILLTDSVDFFFKVSISLEMTARNQGNRLLALDAGRSCWDHAKQAQYHGTVARSTTKRYGAPA